MALSRPLLLALLGMLLLFATFVAVRNSRELVADDPGPTVVQEVQTPAKPAEEPPAAKAKPEAKKTAIEAKKPAEQARATPRARRSTAAAFARAVKSRKLVVLFVYSPGADDAATAQAVAEVKRRTKAAVFTERLTNLERYGPIVADAGVTQTPSVVIVNRKRQARVVEGYVDSRSLLQEVADAR
jgi:hypothetical protein